MESSYTIWNLLIVTILLLFTLPMPSNAGISKYAKYAKFQPCRLYVGFSRCVDSPLNPNARVKWCPYHVCGQSFVGARRCDSKDKKATHYCKTQTVNQIMYECRSGRKHRRVRLPIGCKVKKGECTGWTRACVCQKTSNKRLVYTKYRPAKFKCFTRRYGKPRS